MFCVLNQCLRLWYTNISLYGMCTLNSMFGLLETRLIQIGVVTGIRTEKNAEQIYDFQLVQLITEVASLQVECK